MGFSAMRLLYLFKRRTDLSTQQFVEKLTEERRRAMQLRGVTGAVVSLPITLEGDRPPYDGVFEVEFPDYNTFSEAWSSPDGRAIVANFGMFADVSAIELLMLASALDS